MKNEFESMQELAESEDKIRKADIYISKRLKELSNPNVWKQS